MPANSRWVLIHRLKG